MVLRPQPRAQHVKVIRDDARRRIDGDLPADAIMYVINQRIGAVRACYQRALQRNAGTTGRVVVRFVILPDGQVPAARIGDSDFDDRDFEGCLRQTVEGMKFPMAPSGRNTNVTYPFVFRVR